MEIRIGKGARACSACERDFEHEQELRSLVRLHDGLLNREDYCLSCWEPGRAQGAFSLWSVRFYDPKVAEQEPPEVFSPLRQTFYESVEAEERAELAKAYLAAQLLRRQKVFRLIKESNEPDEEVRLTLFADRIGNTLVEVRDPNLSFQEMETGRQGLMDRLRELETPESEEDTESEETDSEDAQAPAPASATP